MRTCIYEPHESAAAVCTCAYFPRTFVARLSSSFGRDQFDFGSDSFPDRPLVVSLRASAHLALFFHRLPPLLTPAHTRHAFLVVINVVLSPRLPPVLSLRLAMAPVLLAPLPLLRYRELHAERGMDTKHTIRRQRRNKGGGIYECVSVFDTHMDMFATLIPDSWRCVVLREPSSSIQVGK